MADTIRLSRQLPDILWPCVSWHYDLDLCLLALLSHSYMTYFTSYRSMFHQIWTFFLSHEPCSGPAHVAGWSAHSAAMCSRAWRAQWPRFAPQPGRVRLPKIISNNSYTHDEQGVDLGQVRGFDGVLYKLWPLLMLWLAASRYQSRWREKTENRSR